ncbi:MAG: peptidylprolyl isomerase [Nitrospinota bacterium]|nr:peptidylprolyl isomerase [Nitrospinota bacterium]
MMKFKEYGLPVLALVAMLLFQGCTKEPQEPEPRTITVATVNGQNIMGNHFLKEYTAMKTRLRLAEKLDEKVEKRLRDGVIDKIIDSEILLQEARKAGVSVSKSDSDSLVEDILGGFSPARLQLILEKNKSDLGIWKDQVRRNLVIEGLIQKKIAPLVEIQDKELKSYYNEHKEEFSVGERVHAFHIVLPSLSEADEIRNEIVFGGDFEEIAIKYSVSPDGKKGGDLGVFSRGQMPAEFDSILFDLQLNEISRVIESPYGYHIFKVVKKYKPTAMKFEEARGIIYERMFYQRLEDLFSKWMKDAKDQSEIVIFSDRLYVLKP